VPPLPARARYGPGIAAAILVASMLLPAVAAYARQYAYAQAQLDVRGPHRCRPKPARPARRRSADPEPGRGCRKTGQETICSASAARSWACRSGRRNSRDTVLAAWRSTRCACPPGARRDIPGMHRRHAGPPWSVTGTGPAVPDRAGAGAGGVHRRVRAGGTAGVPDRDAGCRGRRAQRGGTAAGGRRLRRLGAAAGRRAGADAPARGTARGRRAGRAGHRAAGQHRGRDGAQPGPPGPSVPARRGGRRARAGAGPPDLILY
jgi:hypothetical protein